MELYGMAAFPESKHTMNEHLEIISHSSEETQQLGSVIGEIVEPGDLILLVGDLGAGKTCLSQGIAWGTGFDGYASSPSFVLVREYQGRIRMYHIDFYRLDDSAEIDDLGIDDYVLGKGVCVIEWADKAFDSLPQEFLIIKFDHIDENQRRLHFESRGKRYHQILNEIKKKWK